MNEFYKAPNINGVKVPYDAGIKELEKGLNGPMKDYVVCLRALAWKGNWKSFHILKNELRNAVCSEYSSLTPEAATLR